MNSSTSTKPIAIVLCGRTEPRVAERYGDFDRWFSSGLATPCTVVEADRGAALEDPASYAVWCSSGSPAMVTAREPWSVAVEDWCRSAHGRLPLLGVCYGHQLLAQALGGDVGDNPGGIEVGRRQLELTTAAASDPLFSGLTAPLSVFESHTQSVLRAPVEAQVLARNAHDAHQALRFGPRTWGVQFHPEFDAAITAGYLEARRVPYTERGLDVDALLDGLEDDSNSRALLTRFTRFVRGENAR